MSEIELNMDMWKRFEDQVGRMGARGSRFAINDFLNTLAFGARRFYPTFLARKMDIRKPKFVSSAFGVRRSRPRTLIAYTHSIGRERFSGWTEQQRGAGKLRKKTGFVRARSGKKESGQISFGFRLNKRSKFANLNDAPGGSPRQKFAILLRQMRERKASERLFIAGGQVTAQGGDLPWGLWKMGNLSGRYPGRPDYRSIHMLQKFDSPKPTTKDEWARSGVVKYLAAEDLKGEWMVSYARSWRHAR